MILQYMKMLAEKQAEGFVRDCVITVPSWFTYDQRLMLKDAAEGLAGLNVLQMTHENLAAATMFGIDQKVENDEKKTVLFYNMGGMDTEVTIAEYSMINVTDKKWSPHIHILAEANVRDMGSKDLDIIIVNLLAEKFNALKERSGKPDVRDNVRAVKRLFKEAVKIKETLSANKFANIKIPELLDYVTLQINLPREEVEEIAKDFFSGVSKPIEMALEKAGLKVEDINQVELIGGGVRVPKVTDILEEYLQRKDLSVHLNGDEAMCFGSAFIASNSSQTMKVKQIFLTHNPEYDILLKISPINPEDAISEEDQLAEGREEADIIKFTQDIKLFNTTDYLGKSKGLSMNYNKNMKLEFFRADDENPILLDTFLLDDIQTQYDYELAQQAKDAEKAKKKAAKKSNSTDEEATPELETEEDEVKVVNPKVKISIEFSRSGYMLVSKATVGTKDDRKSFLNVKHVRKETQLNEEMLRAAKSRMKWYSKRDDDKIKTDVAKNDFESNIYTMRDWLREDENMPYVEEATRDAYIEKLTEWEDWLYDEGAN